MKEGGIKMVYSHKNKKGTTYYLHHKGRLYYFSKDPKSGIDMPAGFTVVENKKTGLPMLKKK